jgi:hypothetical protein
MKYCYFLNIENHKKIVHKDKSSENIIALDLADSHHNSGIERAEDSEKYFLKIVRFQHIINQSEFHHHFR